MKRSTYGSFDAATLRQALSGPGVDTRQWVSMGVVDADTGSSRAVVYDKDYGPCVNVTLEPSGIPVVCRVASLCAGSGEADGEAFAAGDEVVVVIPEGSERSGPVIVGHLNNTQSPFPKTVAGMDVQNNVSFKRRIGPIVEESNTAILFRVSATESFFTLSQDGNATLSSGDKSFLHLGSDFLGLQTGDAQMVLQANQNTKEWRMESQDGTHSTFFRVGGASPGLMSSEQVFIGTNGQAPWQHLVTLEQLLAILSGVLSTMVLPVVGALAGPMVAANVGPELLASLKAAAPLGTAPTTLGLSPSVINALIAGNATQNSVSGATGLATNIVAS